MSWEQRAEERERHVSRGTRGVGGVFGVAVFVAVIVLGAGNPAQVAAGAKEKTLPSAAEAGERGLAEKTQRDLSAGEVEALQGPLEGVVESSWLRVPNDRSRPWHITAVHSPRGIELYAVKHQENVDDVVTGPERYLVIEMSSMGKRVFNLDASRGALPVAGMTRIRQESQPLAGAEADGSVLSSPLSDPNIMELYANLTGDVGDPGFYDDNLIADPSLLFKLFVVNNLIEDVTVAGSFEGNTKPGRAIPTQYLVEPDGYGKLSGEDFAVGYMLQRVMGVNCRMDQPGPDFDVYPARMIISRGQDGVDSKGRTEYLVKAWPVDPQTMRSDFGYMQASVDVGWDANGRLERVATMDVVENMLRNGILGCSFYARPPPEGGTFGRFVSDGYFVVGPATPSGGIDFDETLPPGSTLRELIVE